MLYRINARLAVREGYIEPGGTDRLDDIGDRSKHILLDKGFISLVRAPPLESFPGWSLRAERLGAQGIDALTFLEMTDEDIAETISDDGTVFSPRAVARWREQLNGFLNIGPAKRRH